MFIKLLLLFTTVPIIELALLIKIGNYIGIIYTILLVIITGIIGVSLARSQGFIIITKVKEDLKQGNIPTNNMIEGLLILIGGILLLTPGLLTDITGFILILPGSRQIIAKFIISKLKIYIKNNHFKFKHIYFSGDQYSNKYNNNYVDIDLDEDDE
jgi:UPF0716 protein FxsA